MVEADGRYVLQSGGRARYARVRVRYLADPPPRLSGPRAALAAGLLADSGWSERELAAAVEGAGLGLELAGVAGRCVVTWVHEPDSVPPNVSPPGAFAVAAARAVWAAMGFVPDEATARQVAGRYGLPVGRVEAAPGAAADGGGV